MEGYEEDSPTLYHFPILASNSHFSFSGPQNEHRVVAMKQDFAIRLVLAQDSNCYSDGVRADNAIVGKPDCVPTFKTWSSYASASVP